MTTYDNTNRGAIFKNDRKTTESHPDYTGTQNVNGQDFWVSMWVKTTKDGKPFFSTSIKPKEARTTASDDRPTTRASSDDVIPF